MVSAAQSSSIKNIPPGPSRCWSARNKKLERIQLWKNVLGEVSKTVNNKEDFEVLMSVDSAVKENNPYWRRFSVFLFVYVPVCKWVGGGFYGGAWRQQQSPAPDLQPTVTLDVTMVSHNRDSSPFSDIVSPSPSPSRWGTSWPVFALWRTEVRVKGFSRNETIKGFRRQGKIDYTWGKSWYPVGRRGQLWRAPRNLIFSSLPCVLLRVNTNANANNKWLFGPFIWTDIYYHEST